MSLGDRGSLDLPFTYTLRPKRCLGTAGHTKTERSMQPCARLFLLYSSFGLFCLEKIFLSYISVTIGELYPPLVWSLVCLCKYLINSPANVTPITRRPGHGVMGRLGGAEADINMMLVTVNQNTRTMAS